MLALSSLIWRQYFTCQLTGIVSSESEDDVSIVGHGYRVLGRREVVVTVQETAPIQVQGVLQVDLLDILVRRPSHTDYVEGITVQVERVAQVGLLYWNIGWPILYFQS